MNSHSVAHRFIGVRELLADVDDSAPASDTNDNDDFTWTTLCNLEPRLRQLERDIRAAFTGRNAQRSWYQDYKPRLLRLVGWERNDSDPTDALCGEKAYNTAYAHLSGLLRARRSRVKLGRV